MQGDEQSRRALIEQYRAASEQSQREIGTHETEIAALSGKMTEKRAELEALSKAKLALEAERSQSDRRGRELNENVLNVERSVSKLEQKRATSAMEEQQILDKLWENYELSHSAAQEQRIELESVAEGEPPHRRAQARHQRPWRGQRRRDRGIRAREHALHLPHGPSATMWKRRRVSLSA